MRGAAGRRAGGRRFTAALAAAELAPAASGASERGRAGAAGGRRRGAGAGGGGAGPGPPARVEPEPGAGRGGRAAGGAALRRSLDNMADSARRWLERKQGGRGRGGSWAQQFRGNFFFFLFCQPRVPRVRGRRAARRRRGAAGRGAPPEAAPPRTHTPRTGEGGRVRPRAPAPSPGRAECAPERRAPARRRSHSLAHSLAHTLTHIHTQREGAIFSRRPRGGGGAGAGKTRSGAILCGALAPAAARSQPHFERGLLLRRADKMGRPAACAGRRAHVAGPARGTGL